MAIDSTSIKPLARTTHLPHRHAPTRSMVASRSHVSSRPVQNYFWYSPIQGTALDWTPIILMPLHPSVRPSQIIPCWKSVVLRVSPLQHAKHVILSDPRSKQYKTITQVYSTQHQYITNMLYPPSQCPNNIIQYLSQASIIIMSLYI